MIINGKAIAEEVVVGLEKERAVMSRQPILGILIVGHDAATESFVRIKTRIGERLNIRIIRAALELGATTDVAVSEVVRLTRECDGVVVQLPLPTALYADKILSAIPADKDVDVLNPTISDDMRVVRAPVAGAVAEILHRAAVEVHNKKVVVVGEGRLVGAPCISLLRALGANVSVVSKEKGSLGMLLHADIIVSGAGSPALIKPEMIKNGAVLIDAGTSEQSGKIAGDADPSCAEKCSVFTPVPGGVGPIAVAMLYKNLFALLPKTK